MVSRTLAGGLGGYVLAQVLPVALVAAWGLDRADAVLVAMLLGIGVYALAWMVAFVATTPGRAWTILGLQIAGSALVAWGLR